MRPVRPQPVRGNSQCPLASLCLSSPLSAPPGLPCIVYQASGWNPSTRKPHGPPLPANSAPAESMAWPDRSNPPTRSLPCQHPQTGDRPALGLGSKDRRLNGFCRCRGVRIGQGYRYWGSIPVSESVADMATAPTSCIKTSGVVDVCCKFWVTGVPASRLNHWHRSALTGVSCSA